MGAQGGTARGRRPPAPLPLGLLLLGLGLHALGAAAAAAGGGPVGGGRWEPGAGGPMLLGVNMHKLRPSKGEAEQMGAAFGLVRYDFSWAATEPAPGAYNFTAYEDLVEQLADQGMRALLLLAYNNPHAPGCGNSTHSGVRTAACVEAYARWAVAAMGHFEAFEPQPIFELWNEPTEDVFWNPHPNATEYARLALAVDRARAAAGLKATTTLIGPAASWAGGSVFNFLRQLAAAGVFAAGVYDAVSVHPYRGEPPETVLVGDCPRCNYYEKVRNVTGIADTVPLVSSEWGYSTCQVAEKAVCDGVTELRQAKFLARMTLANIAAGVAAQVWYDYQDDCDNPGNRECRYGVVRQTEPHQSKPAFLAAQTLKRAVSGKRLGAQLPAPPGAFALRFEDSTHALWAWDGPRVATCEADVGEREGCGEKGISEADCAAKNCCFDAATPAEACFQHPKNTTAVVEVAAAPGQCFAVLQWNGTEAGKACAGPGGSLNVTVGDAVQYLIPT